MACHSSMMFGASVGKVHVLGLVSHVTSPPPPMSGSDLAVAGTSGGPVARTPACGLSAWFSLCVLILVPSQLGAVFLVGI